jgi:hypothetical protein
MSNDPNRIVQQQRHIESNKSHGTMETVKLEKGSAGLPRWQQYLLYALAAVGVVAIILFVISLIA